MLINEFSFVAWVINMGEKKVSSIIKLLFVFFN